MPQFTTEEHRLINGISRTLAETMAFDETTTLDEVKKQVEAELQSSATDLIGKVEAKSEVVSFIVDMFKTANLTRQLVSTGAERLEIARDALQQQVETGNIVFRIPKKHRSALSKEERTIYDFTQLVKDHLSAFGIRMIDTDDAVICRFMSLFRMHTGAMEPVLAPGEVGRVLKKFPRHISIGLHLCSSEIMKPFGVSRGKYFDFLMEYINGNASKEMNQARLAMCMMLSFSNLLWLLLYPMDTRSKAALTAEECIERCKVYSKIITQIFADNARPHLGDQAKTLWAVYIKRSQSLITMLRKAYEHENLKKFPIGDLARSAREAAETSVTALFELLCQHHDASRNMHQDEFKTAEDLLEILEYLGMYLQMNPDILLPFRKQLSLNPLPDDPGLKAILNEKPETLIDVLIIYLHYPDAVRSKIISDLLEQEKNKQLSSGSFCRMLQMFDERVIQSLDRVLHKKDARMPAKVRAFLLGKYFVPCLTYLIAASGEIDVDTSRSCALAKSKIKEALSACEMAEFSESSETSEVSMSTIQNTGKVQVELINDLNQEYFEVLYAEGGECKGDEPARPYFLCEPGELMHVKKTFRHQVNKMPYSIDKLIRIAKITDNKEALILGCPGILQDEQFKTVLVLFTKDMRQGYLKFQMMCHDTEGLHSKDEGINAQLEFILGPILEKLQGVLVTSEKALAKMKNIASEPNAKDSNATDLNANVNVIQTQYPKAFGKSCDLESIFSDFNLLKNATVEVVPSSPRHQPEESSTASTVSRQRRRISVARLPNFFSRAVTPPNTTKQREVSPPSPFVHRLQVTGSRQKMPRFSPMPASASDEVVRLNHKVDELESQLANIGSIREQERIKLIECERKAVKQLIEACFNAMTFESKMRKKGEWLLAFQHAAETQPVLNVKAYVHDIARVAFSTRPTCFGFYQKQPWESESALAFRSQIEELKHILPFHEVFLADGSDMSANIGEADIRKTLKRWEDAGMVPFSEDNFPEEQFTCLGDTLPLTRPTLDAHTERNSFSLELEMF